MLISLVLSVCSVESAHTLPLYFNEISKMRNLFCSLLCVQLVTGIRRTEQEIYFQSLRYDVRCSDWYSVNSLNRGVFLLIFFLNDPYIMNFYVAAIHGFYINKILENVYYIQSNDFNFWQLLGFLCFFDFNCHIWNTLKIVSP